LGEFRDLRLIPDWPRIRNLVAKRLGKTEDEVQAMKDGGDSLERVELVMAVEEVLDVQRR
jgi:acyl carrier protein